MCRQLGLGDTGARVIPNYGGGTGQIWLDEITCPADGASLLDCQLSQPAGTNDCTHDEDVGVICTGGK